MAKVLLVHLSDIHVRSEHDPILTRAESIAAAIRNLDYDLDTAIIAVSGDLAFAGSPAHYEAVWTFLRELKQRLQQTLTATHGSATVSITILAIPGNHDCDFSTPSGARDIVVEGVLSNPHQAADTSVVELCTSVQNPFFEALATYGTGGLGQPTSSYDCRLGYSYDIAVGDQTIRFLCFNTAWLSHRKEAQSRLYLPAEIVPAPPQDAALVVAMLHHPYNWMGADEARAFRKRVESVADLILTGHEHDPTRRTQTGSMGERNEYVEGGALQESGDPVTSVFHAFVLDVANRKQKAATFAWDSVRYTPLGVDLDAGDGFGLAWEDLQVAHLRERESFEPSEAMRRILDDPGATLTLRDRGVLGLRDIFVFPDLQEVTHSVDNTGQLVSGETVTDLVLNAPRLIILGDANAGKTCLAKMLFWQLRTAGYVPLLVDGGAKLPSGDRLHAHLMRLVGEQYDSAAKEAYRQLDRTQRVIIVDDYHRLSVNVQVRRSFIEAVTQFAGKVILLADDLTTEAADLFDPLSRADNAAPFATFRILPLGHLRRDALVDKWLLLSDMSNVTAAELAQRRHALTTTLDSLIGRTLLPPYPVYILAVLQANEALTPWDSRISTHGAYYELLIRNALASGRPPVQSDIVLSYLAHFAHDLFRHGRSYVDDHQLGEIHRRFEQRYDLPVSMKALRADLASCHILTVSNDVTRFKYEYIYYYFVARWFRDHIGEDEIREAIGKLSRSVHIEEHANILLFLAHLSKEPLIVDSMMDAARSFYQDLKPVTFEGDVDFLVALRGADNHLVFEDQDVDESRRHYLAALDEHDAHVAALNSDESNVDVVSEVLDPLSTLTAATKTLQILGQILKNFPGSLEGDVKLVIARECYALGLRTLAWIYGVLRDDEGELVRLTAEMIRASHPNLTERQVELRARDTIVSLAEVIGVALVRLISSAVGSTDLDQTYERVEQHDGTAAVRIINASIDLDQSSSFPEGEIRRLAKEFANWPFARSVLSYLVMIRFHLFPVSEPTKRQVCAALAIQYTPKLDASPRRQLVGRR